ncbi:hypothetical protein DID88_007998 [Monilinia fructigena]|uniref:Uncharacterized protein n=1 Tax=Monilinia fructigena TaxID=38457 RepID=A0A395J6C5_9HELO|nr:hypothetical protein DID88_007998 [Monilinia fructigena]
MPSCSFECIRSSKKCDVQGPSESDWESLSRQKERLDQEEEDAMAKILRLRKQKSFLLKRESEMLRRGLRALDELVEAEEKERLEKEKIEKERVEEETANVDAASAPIGSSSFDFFDPSLPELSDADLEALLAGVGTSGGMPSSIVSTSYMAFGLTGSISVNGAFGAPGGAGSSKDMWNTGWIFIVSGNFNR